MFTLPLSVTAPVVNSDCTRRNSERHGSVANSLSAMRPLSRAPRYARLSRKRLPYATWPPSIVKRWSIAWPSNQ